MIGEPTLDPALGEKRRKALQAALARAAGFGGPSEQSAPRYGGVGRGSVSGFGFKPISRGGRPSSILNFLGSQTPGGYLNGRASFFGAGGGLGKLIRDVQMPQPLSTAGTVGTGGGAAQAGGISSLGAPATAAAGLDADGNPLPGNKVVGGAYQVNPTQVHSDGSAFAGSLPGWGAPPATASGMIPLGGGVFLDPDTGMIHGAGM